MDYKFLGNTKQKVASIGQGCMGIGGYLEKDTSMDKKQIKMLKLGIQLGMTFIDTAEDYGNGHSEELVGEAIKGNRDNVFIATKFSQKNNSYDGVIKSVEKSLKRLNIDCIDLCQVHWPNPMIPIKETMLAMEHLVKQEKIRYIGVCNFSLNELKEAQSAISNNIIASIQLEYNLFDRTIENNLLPYCKSNYISVIAYSPLDNGRIVSGDEKIKFLKEISNKYEKTMPQIVLNWLITHPSVIAIPKSSNPIHIKENSKVTDFKLTEKDYRKISKVFKNDYVFVPANKIRVITGGQGNRQVYQTIEEAIENKLGSIPSPEDLAQSIRQGEILKPIRVIKTTDKTGKYEYDLIEGRIRYWACVIAYGKDTQIPIFIREF